MEEDKITIFYYHDNPNISVDIINLLMKKSIQADIHTVENIARNDDEFIKQLIGKVEGESLVHKNEKDIIKRYRQNLDAYQQLLEQHKVNQESFKLYLAQKKEGDKMNGVNINIVDMAQTSCPILGYFW